MTHKKKIVGIIYGGPSHEEYLSKKSVETILDSINQSKYDFILLEWLKTGNIVEYRLNSKKEIQEEFSDFLKLFSKIKIDILFNAMHGEKENYGKISGFCELLGIPYTGNGVMTSIIGINKILSNFLFEKIKIGLPEYIYIRKSNISNNNTIINEVETKLNYPVIVKPICGGSSYCILTAENNEELTNQLKKIPENMSLLIQNFIYGKEYSVGIFGRFREQEALIKLPVAHICYTDKFFDEKTKHDGNYKVEIPSGLNKSLEEQLIQLAKLIHMEFHFEAFSRTDFIIDENNQIYVLEVNTHPGLSKSSIITNMLKYAGIDFSVIIDKMIKDGLSRIII